MSQPTLGQSIRYHRKEKNMTQGELAERLGVSVQAVSKWETDKGAPDISQLLPLSRELGMSVDLLLGGDRREEFEQRFQKALPFGEDFTVLVALDALKEFPDDEIFRYRLACDEKIIGERSTSKSERNLYFNRAAIHFRELHNQYPENEIYTSMLADTLHAQGYREEAMKLIGSCKDPKKTMAMFYDGDEERRFHQEKLYRNMMVLYGRLCAIGNREALEAAHTLLDTLLGEDMVYCENTPWNLYTWEAKLCREEGNTEGFVSAMTKAYEAAKRYDEIPFGSYPHRAPLFDLLTQEVDRHGALHAFMHTETPLLADPAVADLRRRIVDEQVECHPLYRHEWMAYFQFCQRHICENHYHNFSISFDMPYHENRLKEWMTRYPGYAKEAMMEGYRSMVEELVGGGIMRGYAAYFGNDLLAYCNCGAKEKYKCLAISEEERAIPTAPEGSRILSIVEILVARGFENVGLDDKLLASALAAAKKKGYTHAEAYPLERMTLSKEAFETTLSCYERAGFAVVRDLSSEQDKRYFIMQKEL